MSTFIAARSTGSGIRWVERSAAIPAFERRWVRYFLNAAPSLAEIVMLGKVAWHAGREMEHGRPRWDLVVLDAPATGHGLTFLSVPEVFLSIVKECLS